MLQASCPLCNPVRRGPLLGGLFGELLCERQRDQAGDGLDARPALGLLHQLASAVAGRSSALRRQSLEVESILRYVRRYARTQHERRSDCPTKNTGAIDGSVYRVIVFVAATWPRLVTRESLLAAQQVLTFPPLLGPF